jgi:hypothetical protein
VPDGRPLPDAQAWLIAWTKLAFPDARAALRVPADLTKPGALPLIQPVRIGGPSRLTLDDPIVDIDCYATDEVAAYTLARAFQTALTRASGVAVTYGSERAVLCDSRCTQGPAWRPYDNPDVYRVGQTFQITLQAA